MEIIRDMRIYEKNGNITLINDIYSYTIYTKADTLEILTQTEHWKKYKLSELSQVDVLTRKEKQNFATYTDTILL